MLREQDVELKQVIDFWFIELTSAERFTHDPLLDQEIRDRFLSLHERAACGELHHWRRTGEGAVAEIILLDQMSRNMFRGTPRMFAYDGMALTVAQQVVDSGMIKSLKTDYQELLLMPYMHSESLYIHDEALVLREKYRLDTHWEIQHRQIIEQFGRYPHRNTLLGRVTTAEERIFLQQPGSSF